MGHNLSITLAKKPVNTGIICCRKLPIREKLLTWLLGPKHNVMILVPGNTVQEIDIKEIKLGGNGNETV